MGFSQTPQWFKFMFISFFLLPTAAATLMTITQFTYAGNTMCVNLIIYRFVRTEADILLSYKT
jgi:hypothetical protein